MTARRNTTGSDWLTGSAAGWQPTINMPVKKMTNTPTVENLSLIMDTEPSSSFRPRKSLQQSAELWNIQNRKIIARRLGP